MSSQSMEVESLNQELKCKIRSANVLKRKATDKHTHSERETILDCLAAGLQACERSVRIGRSR